MERIFRTFVDTSVFGGCFEGQFASDSVHIIDLAKAGRLKLLVRDVVLLEIAPAPEPVRRLVAGLPASCFEVQTTTREVATLRDAYIQNEVVSPRWLNDAAHVATATVARADALISWNFKHIVRLDRIKAFNQVNLANGYGILTILSPKELREYGA